MNVLVPLLVGGVLLAVASRFYGGFLAKWLGIDEKRKTPAVAQEDGRDFVPTRPHILFAHHFSAIAGAGPIVGPTMALLYGYAPGWFWIILGGIFFGAAHDLSALFVSVRSGGRSMAEIARTTLGSAGFTLFILFSLMMIILVTSAFLALTSISLTSMWPLAKLGLDASQTVLNTVPGPKGEPLGVIGGIASMSVIIVTLFSPLLGYLVYKRRLPTLAAYGIAAAVCALSIVAGFHWPVRFSELSFGLPWPLDGWEVSLLGTQVWMLILSVYVLFAAGVPVWLILQPRDFINVQILYVGIVLLVVGLVSAGLQGAQLGAPAANLAEGTAKLGLIWPMLFITIACGAISGFHSMVASGTSAKQVSSERYVKRIGYDAMLLESLLALCVLVVVGSMLAFGDYKSILFPTGAAAKSNPALAFSLAVGHLLNMGLGIPTAFGTVFGILLIEGFVITTLDAAVRLNRYLFEELWEIILGKGRVPAVMRHPWFNSGLSVALMLFLAWTNAFLALWPIFAAANQLLAALSLIAVSAWLVTKGGKRRPLVTLVPAVAMLVTTGVSLVILLERYVRDAQWSLVVADIALLALSLGVAILAIFLRRKPAPVAAAAAPSRGGEA